MTGLILAGVDPLDAVQVQAAVMFVVLASVGDDDGSGRARGPPATVHGGSPVGPVGADRRGLAGLSGGDQRRPTLGRLPWLALLRRARSLRFFVFLLTEPLSERDQAPRLIA